MTIFPVIGLPNVVGVIVTVNTTVSPARGFESDIDAVVVVAEAACAELTLMTDRAPLNKAKTAIQLYLRLFIKSPECLGVSSMGE